jgi:hypothetical protein
MLDKLTFNKFKDHEIDVDHNNKIFSIFDECIEILLKNNIDFIVGGSIGLILNTNNIYRNIGDIDFHIKHTLIPNQILLFKKNDINPAERRLIGKNLFLKNNIIIECNFLILPYSKIIKNSKIINYKSYEIKLVSVKDILMGKELSIKNILPNDQNKNHLKRKQKYLNDIEFYSQYQDIQ